jgi:hypothetical protein
MFDINDIFVLLEKGWPILLFIGCIFLMELQRHRDEEHAKKMGVEKKDVPHGSCGDW